MMHPHFKQILETLILDRNSEVGLRGIYSNWRNILESVVRENLGEKKFNSLHGLPAKVDDFCCKLNIDKKGQSFLHKFRMRANMFMHENAKQAYEYFADDLKTLCIAVKKATKEDIPDDLKSIYQKPKIIKKETENKATNIQKEDVIKPKETIQTPEFNRFIKFGSISDEKTRKEIAKHIYENVSEIGLPLESENKDIGSYIDTINQILNKDEIYDLTNNNPELSEKITEEILNFINKTQKLIHKTENPFMDEAEMLENFMKTTNKSFKKNWEATKKHLDKTYKKEEVDTGFYEKEFIRSFNKKEKNRPSFNSVKEHLTDKWSDLLFKKRTAWELDIIDKERKTFCEELYKNIEQLKKLQELLEPFGEEFGRLWDMSKGDWQKVNFDILQKYADLLKRDKSIQELAEMLGKMHQAEQEMEEEIFTDIKLTTAWKIENSAKSDLIGVHESDEISNALPSEFALLADPTTETVFYKKLVEKKLQTFEYQGRTQEIIEEEFENKRQKTKEDKKGPFIICVDTSGSMHGTPETVAKTLCFAILKIAIRENRKCYLISFSTGIETLNLTDLKNSLDKVIQFLQMSFHGGTDASPAMRESLRMLETEDYKKADVIMISDFVMSAFDENTQKQITKAKENNTKFHSLIIGNSQNKGVIKDFDNNWLYDVNNKNSILTLVKNIHNLK